MRNRPLTWGTGIPLAALAIWHVWLVATRSAERRQYFDGADPAISSWRYPTHIVVGVSLLILTEAAILWLVLFSPGPPARWRRARLGIVLTCPAALLAFVMLPVDQPAYQRIHGAWLFELTVIAVMTLAISAVGALVSRSKPKTT